MDSPSAQLALDLRDSITRALASRRPLLHHLNADTSWLLQIPRPASVVARGGGGGRAYFNVLIDPWLAGGQSDVAKWFSQQWHADESRVPDVAAVEELVSADVPVFATEKAAALISSWHHFRTVLPVPPFSDLNPDWTSTSIPPLPDWLGIARLLSRRDSLAYHSALLFTFHTGPPTPSAPSSSKPVTGHDGGRKRKPDGPPDEDAAVEAIIYTPHGIQSADLAFIATAEPPIRTLAFLHGLHDITIGAAQQLNLGAHNGLQAQRLLRARYWISTHDEVKKGGGLVSWFLRRRVVSVKDALMEERRRRGGDGVGGGGDGGEEALGAFDGVGFVELGNGESRVLL
ncbi:hypothetical protein LTR50_002461 [Elasticomyces elasticus]|nr:hypothetical protein LTR50_002461 [Elasticomyces elasticus]